MKQDHTDLEGALQKTRTAFMWTNVLNTPFWAIFNLLPFILYRDLHATPLQVTLIIILKPAVSIISLYWSALINKRKDRLLSNLIWARVISHVPFFFFPFVDSPWYFIAAFGLYMTMFRGTIPAWMEVLKLNIPGVSRERTFAFGSAFNYVGTAIFPFALGWLMDAYFQSWRWIFPVTALISLLAILFKYRIPIQTDDTDTANVQASCKEIILKPWKDAWQLIKRRPDFARYQLGFMLGGSGLILMQPALPDFFMSVLNLSYTELAVALTLCKGIGFIATSSMWAQIMGRINIFLFNSWVTMIAVFFPLCLIAAQYHVSWIYVGYLLYGVMQAGSEMSWNLSGPLFAKEEDSSVYSSINVMTVGLRGCVVPAFGSILCFATNPVIVMLAGGFLCLLASNRMSYYSRQTKIHEDIAAV